MRVCNVCKVEFDETAQVSGLFQEAGEWLSGEVWQDSGQLCPQCLENRARLAMMYAHDLNR